MRKYWHLVVCLVLLTSCSRENPYKVEMEGIIRDNQSLRELADIHEKRYDTARDLLLAVQDERNLQRDVIVHLSNTIVRIEQEKADLQRQVDEIAERRRQAEQQAQQQKLEQDSKRQAALTQIAQANQKPPFRVFDVMYVGEKKSSSIKKTFGRFSVRNYTDKPITVSASSSGSNIFRNGYVKVTIPPNNSSNSIFIASEPKAELKVSGAGHEEVFTW